MLTVDLKRRIDELERDNEVLREQIGIVEREMNDLRAVLVEEMRFMKNQMCLMSRTHSEQNSAVASPRNSSHPGSGLTSRDSHSDDLLTELSRRISRDLLTGSGSGGVHGGGEEPHQIKKTNSKKSRSKRNDRTDRNEKTTDKSYLDIQYALQEDDSSGQDPSSHSYESHKSSGRRRSSGRKHPRRPSHSNSLPHIIPVNLPPPSGPRPILKTFTRSAPASTRNSNYNSLAASPRIPLPHSPSNSIKEKDDHKKVNIVDYFSELNTEKEDVFQGTDFASPDISPRVSTIVHDDVVPFTAHHFRNTQMQPDAPFDLHGNIRKLPQPTKPAKDQVQDKNQDKNQNRNQDQGQDKNQDRNQKKSDSIYVDTEPSSSYSSNNWFELPAL